MTKQNIILQTDSYKVSHYKQYPPGTQTVYSYLESRGGKWTDTVFFGLQYFLKEYLEGVRVTQEDIDYAKERLDKHLGPGMFNEPGWNYIINKHGGRLPISIKAVPEGTPVPTGHPLIVVQNTDPACWWLTNYLETLLVQVWYPCTVATQSREMKALIRKYLNKTGDPSTADFKLWDFGFRGVSSCESAGIGGMAHLVNFKGSDTMAAFEYAKKYYGEDMAANSISASEHSTICAWGRENEDIAFRNMLEAYPKGIIACISDSYNIFDAIANKWGGYPLKDMIMQRDGTLVVRADSGEPVDVLVTGNENVCDLIWDKFGGTINEKGFKVFDPHIRIIQSDGVDIETIDAILHAMQRKGYSTDNITFGSGGVLLQRLHRDTQRMAFKCSAAKVMDQWREVYKQPITDHGKNSKRGQVVTLKSDAGGFLLGYENQPIPDGWDDCMVEVFRDGNITKEYSFSEVRFNAQ